MLKTITPLIHLIILVILSLIILEEKSFVELVFFYLIWSISYSLLRVIDILRQILKVLITINSNSTLINQD